MGIKVFRVGDSM